MLPWYRVRDALLSKVQRMADRIELRMDVSIERVVQKDDKMLIASFQDSSLAVEADVIIGADGVHSYVRTDILRLPPAVSTGAHVWRGSLNINGIDDLKHFEEYGIGKNNQFGDKMIMFYFNFHAKTPGLFSWVFSVQDPSGELGIKLGETTPLDMIRSYMESQSSPDEKLLQQCADAKLVLENTHSSSDLTWSTQMAVVDLTAEAGWGGKGRITLVGDAAHSIRPANGLGGSLAFEDATLLSRVLSKDSEDDGSGADVANRLRDFEGKRLPRCKSISRDQTLCSTLSYKLGYEKVPPWDQRYREWVFDGLAAAPTPPVSEEAVFANVLACEQSALAQ